MIITDKTMEDRDKRMGKMVFYWGNELVIPSEDRIRMQMIDGNLFLKVKDSNDDYSQLILMEKTNGEIIFDDEFAEYPLSKIGHGKGHLPVGEIQ